MWRRPRSSTHSGRCGDERVTLTSGCLCHKLTSEESASRVGSLAREPGSSGEMRVRKLGPITDGGAKKPAEGSRQPLSRQPAKLAPGSRLPATVVRASQRERMMVALIEAVDSKGLAAATVADLTARAHVARAAFYNQFDSLEECFLASCDAQAQRIGEQVTDAYRTRGLSWDERIEATIGALAHAACEWPAAARVCLSDILAAGPAAHEHTEQTIALVRQLLRQDGAGAGARPQISRHAAVALTGGLRRLICEQLREGAGQTNADGPDARRLARELTWWLLACFPPSGGGAGRAVSANGHARAAHSDSAHDGSGGRAGGRSGAGTDGRGKLAGGRGHADHLVHPPAGRSEAAGVRSQQIVQAVLELAASKGCEAMTQRDIARRAKVSFSTFYDHFDSKQHALLAATQVASERLLDPIDAAAADAQDWAHGVRAGIAAYLRAAATHPEEARVVGLEVLSVGHAGSEQREHHAGRLERLLEPGFELRPESPPGGARAFAGAALELLRCCAIDQQTADLPEAAPELSYIALAPFIGRKDAQRIAGYRPRYPARAGPRKPLTFDQASRARRVPRR